MKQISLIIIAAGLLLMLYGCPDVDRSRYPKCTYKYPVNIKNLKDTIKPTDTLWVENDFDIRLCLNEGVLRNGFAEECPTFYKLINDTLIWYSALIIGYDRVDEQVLGLKRYWIDIRERDGRYKSRYGIIFPEQGTYALRDFLGELRSEKDGYVRLQSYFETPNNNDYLLPEKLQRQFANIPYDNYVYFIAVVE